MNRALISGLAATVLLMAGCAQGPSVRSVQGRWETALTKGCEDVSITIDAQKLSVKIAGSSLDNEIDLREDSRGIVADVYLVSRDLSRKMDMVYPIRLSLQDGALTFSSESKQPLGTAWLHVLQSMQPLHRCPSS